MNPAIARLWRGHKSREKKNLDKLFNFVLPKDRSFLKFGKRNQKNRIWKDT